MKKEESVRKADVQAYIPKNRFDQVNKRLKETGAAMEALKKEYALKDKLREAGAIDADYIIYKQGGLDGFKFDKNGKPEEMDDLLKSLKRSFPYLFHGEEGALILTISRQKIQGESSFILKKKAEESLTRYFYVL